MVLKYMSLCATRQRTCTTGGTLMIRLVNGLERKYKIQVSYNGLERKGIIYLYKGLKGRFFI